MPKPTCSIVIPVYNSQASLPALVGQLVAILPSITSDFEIILVNDGSKDQSWQVITQLSEQYPNICALDLARNFGQHNALLCGIRQAKHEVIVTIDDDLQNPPSEIVKLLDKLDSGFDLVYGTPSEGTHGLWRNIASRLMKWALRTTIRVPDAQKFSAFRAFRTALRDSFTNYASTYVSIEVLLSWGTTKIGFIEVDQHKRQVGKSNYSLRRLFRLASNIVFGFSVVPLRIASVLGFIFTLFGFVILAYVLISYLIRGGSVPGFPFLASTIAIFSGIILFVLGIMGEYLARMYTNMMMKPPYTIRTIIGDTRSEK